MKNTLTDVMMRLIRFEIDGAPLPSAWREVLTEPVIEQLYLLSARHDLAHLVGAALDANDLLPDAPIREKFREKTYLSVARYRNMQTECERLFSVLEAAKIPFLPLKGTVLRSEYPEPWMRTSCDIDILVHPEDLSRASDAIHTSLGYAVGESCGHHLCLRGPGNLLLELHFRLIENENENDRYTAPLVHIWEHARPEAGGMRFVLDDAMFYYFHLAHMAKHFSKSGGCGVRSFLDLLILDRRPAADRRGREELVREGGLSAFAAGASRLAAVWFDDAEADETVCEMQEYVIHGGIYGTLSNVVSARRARRGGKLRYLLSRLFPSSAEMRPQYPILARHGWLLPIKWVQRGFRLLSPESRRRARSEWALNRSTDAEHSEKVGAMMRALGL